MLSQLGSRAGSRATASHDTAAPSVLTTDGGPSRGLCQRSPECPRPGQRAGRLPDRAPGAGIVDHGVVVVGILYAVMEKMIEGYLSTAARDDIGFTAMILALLLCTQGLFGRGEVQKV